jgi:phosphatidylglycerol:prolipoprotein diacylglycerol transferase
LDDPIRDANIHLPFFGENAYFSLPKSFDIFGFPIYLYGLFITAGFALAVVYVIRRHKFFGLTKDNMLDLVIISVLCGLVGARIYYVLFNVSTYFGAGKWQEIYNIRKGGLAVYGGIIASGIGFLVYGRVKKIQRGKLLDVAGFGLFIGQAVGRWGNFVNREAFGVETDLPWRMGLFVKTEYSAGINVNDWRYFHPTFLYEALWNVAGFLIMHIYSKKRKTTYHGQYFLFYVAWYGLGRAMIEGLRVDSLYLWGTDFRVSQVLAVISLFVAVTLMFSNHQRGVRAPIGPPEDEDEDEGEVVDDEEKDAPEEDGKSDESDVGKGKKKGKAKKNDDKKKPRDDDKESREEGEAAGEDADADADAEKDDVEPDGEESGEDSVEIDEDE